MLRNVSSECLEAGLESAYAVIVPSAKEAMAKRVFGRSKISGAGRLPPGPRAKPRPGKRVPITKDAQNRVRTIIEDWSLPTLRWEDLLPILNKEFHGDWQRQSLAKHAKIQTAFQRKKEELRQARLKGPRKGRTADSTVEYLNKQVRLLTEENADLKGKLRDQEARMARWRHNAFLHRVTIEQLGARPDRDRGQAFVSR
jgi:hypothetical protein